MEFISVAAQSVFSVDRTNDVTPGTEIIIEFDFNIPDVPLKNKMEKFLFKTASRSAVHHHKSCIENLRLHSIKIPQQIIFNSKTSLFSEADQLIDSQLCAAQ